MRDKWTIDKPAACGICYIGRFHTFMINNEINNVGETGGAGGGEKNPEIKPEKRRRRFGERPVGARIGIVAAWVVGCVILLAVALLCSLTLFLTPQRLTSIINREASDILDAKVKVSNARFTFWSTFPHFYIAIDSLSVTSHSLRGLPTAAQAQLPDSADFLASTGKFSGSINIVGLMRGKILLHNVKVDRLNLNLFAATDSITNYNIWPQSDDAVTVPYFHADTVLLTNPGKIRYRSLVSKADVRIDLRNAGLSNRDRKGNVYRLDMTGNVSARVSRLEILSGFPFNLNGLLQVRFKPFGIKTENYAVKLGNLTGKVNMDIEIGQEAKLNRFNYRLDNFNLNRLLQYLPAEAFPYLSRLNADLTVNASAALTSTYNFSSSDLPSAQVDFNIPDGNIKYTLSDNRVYSLRHIGAGGRLVFDGHNPSRSYFSVPEFRLAGEGMALDIGARANNLMGDPAIEATVRGAASIRQLGALVPALQHYILDGKLNTDSRLRFHISDLKEGNFENVAIRGDVSLENLRADGPEINARLKELHIRFGAEAEELTNDILAKGLFNLKATGDGLSVSSGDYTICGSNLDIASHLSDNRVMHFANMLRTIPYDVDITAAAITVKNPKDTVNLKLNDVRMNGTVETASNPLVAKRFQLQVDGKNLLYRGPQLSSTLSGISLNARADALTHPVRTADYKMPAIWKADSADISTLRHSPLFLKVDIPEGLRRVMGRWRIRTLLDIKRGELLTKAFPVRNRFADLSVAASFDSLLLKNVSLSSLSTAARVSGSVRNLRQFLTSATPAPLRLKLDIALDTVQINQLAGAYERGLELTKGPGASKNIRSATVSASDTVAMMLPRNLIADIHASAMQTRYMNLHLYDLGARMALRDGDLDISGLHISADFGRALLDFTYRTRNVEDLSMQAALTIGNVNVVRFFQNFHTLLLMMPEMKNLSGTLSAKCDGRVLLFPDMYINMPSVLANINVTGRGLTVHQNPFIRNITKMMLIRTDGDLHIANMDVHASIHDNLLELYPFNFEFDRYKLRMEGVNNFNGRIYYHIGVDKSPVPFPFGINIQGMFHHPELRFGGPAFKIKKAQEITSSVMEGNKMNLIKELKYYFAEFLHAAARSDTTSATDYAF